MDGMVIRQKGWLSVYKYNMILHRIPEVCMLDALVDGSVYVVA